MEIKFKRRDMKCDTCKHDMGYYCEKREWNNLSTGPQDHTTRNYTWDNCKKFKPKQEDNVEKSCETCDNSIGKSWNPIPHTPCECDRTYNNWKLRRDFNQENKEQEMSYKPTSTCTLKNIAEKIEITNCDEARAEYFKFALELERDGYGAGISKSVIQIDSPLWIRITKTEKRRNWLLKFGFLEEEIILKPCPFCNSEDVSSVNEDYVECNVCDTCGPLFKTEKEAIKAWNTRK